LVRKKPRVQISPQA